MAGAAVTMTVTGMAPEKSLLAIVHRAPAAQGQNAATLGANRLLRGAGRRLNRLAILRLGYFHALSLRHFARKFHQFTKTL
jgi:hypothetical protein